MTSIKFNTSSSCVPPLITTTNEKSWYPDVDGCGVQCQNPLFTESDHDHAHAFIAIVGSICVVCTLFAVVSYLFQSFSLIFSVGYMFISNIALYRG